MKRKKKRVFKKSKQALLEDKKKSIESMKETAGTVSEGEQVEENLVTENLKEPSKLSTDGNLVNSNKLSENVKKIIRNFLHRHTSETAGENYYTIKISTAGEDITRDIHISKKLWKYGVFSLAGTFFLFIAITTIAGYSLFANHINSQAMSKLREVNTLQQEKLTSLAVKANELQQQLDKITATENAIKSVANVNVSLQDDPYSEIRRNVKNGGEGGPIVPPNLQNTAQMLDIVEKRLQIHDKNMLVLKSAFAQQQKEQAAMQAQNLATPTGWPASGYISSPFGFRWHGTDFHPGVDIAADYGTPIRATADGVVTYAGWNAGGYGNMVDINHGNGLMTRYGHAMRVVAYVGEHVHRGDVVAYVGSTGYSTGPHVHYEVRLHGKPIDPAPYL